jgi:hypothetical protein
VREAARDVPGGGQDHRRSCIDSCGLWRFCTLRVFRLLELLTIILLRHGMNWLLRALGSYNLV